MAKSYAEMNVEELLELNEKVTKYIAYKAYEAGSKGDEGLCDLFSGWNSEERIELNTKEKQALEKRSIFDQWNEEGGQVDFETQFKRIQQAERDRIVAKARKDIDELKVKIPRHLEYTEFVVNREKSTVVALIRNMFTNEVRARGIAKCAPSDCFNVHIGKAIALRRALGLFVPTEYLNVPQPTEVE